MSQLDQPMSARRQLRLAIVGELRTKIQGVTIVSPGDWPTPPEKLPALLVNVPTEQKSSINRGMPEFTTTASVVVQGQVTAITAEEVQDRIEDLAYRVENAILMGYWIVRMVQQFVTVQTDIECTADGGKHLAGFRMTIAAEMFEAFDPTAEPSPESPWPPADPTLAPFENAKIHLDTATPFDPTGTYPNPPFPDAVLPAPRTSGPDGRDEGALDIQLPQ
ncbi:MULTISPECIES: hypothetical protein [unclassified Variovorax]|uniref:hypothetical protein n=1 Tax=unclassified Variovorax TaxID=663243 RepID=UPI00076D6DBB|nr:MULTISPECIES: hypothetical protein [unclassified Variovorax]KWT89351.1 hypothetical protein APY03_3430 [Variovorax sp. WDL1]PNG56528.1 hypothetical protein CHC07_02947 [Variovorax sp. B4]PNG57952.1 hypothetical protein CHC06_02950 [Variovorax sp. B2]VTV09580.1 hypothetical protein WDL1CHR_00676 [Variovorax sp. WDL1]